MFVDILCPLLTDETKVGCWFIPTVVIRVSSGLVFCASIQKNADAMVARYAAEAERLRAELAAVKADHEEVQQRMTHRIIDMEA